MIKIEDVDVDGWKPAIRGMRNSLNSWKKSDSYAAVNCAECGLIEERGICEKADNFIDIAGYAACAGELVSKKNE